MGRVAVGTLRDFKGRVRHGSTLDFDLEVGVAGVAQCRTPALDQFRSRSQVASSTRVLERGMNRAGREQRFRQGTVRIVALDAVHRRHIGTQVHIDQILIGIVAHEAQLGHRCSELECLGTPVGIVACRAILGGGRMGPSSLH